MDRLDHFEVESATSPSPQYLNVGVDVGSTTVKVVVLDAPAPSAESTCAPECGAETTTATECATKPAPSSQNSQSPAKPDPIQPHTRRILYSTYVRHHANQAQTVLNLLREITEKFPNKKMRAAICGSGAMGLSKAFNLPFVQEVVANSIAIQAYYPHTRTAIELGGQDAKMIFFAQANTNTSIKDIILPNRAKDELVVSDMRMNGACAGGTGAFIDEIATLLKIPVEEFNDYAARGTNTYDVSGRCGVYAKTDIQPLLNQGVSREDLALSSFHAIAKQTIGGLAQGLDITPPVIFEGGPLTFNPKLISVFAQRLSLSEEDVIVPQHPETMIALGAAMSLDTLFAGQVASLDLSTIEAAVKNKTYTSTDISERSRVFFDTPQARDAFLQRVKLPDEPHFSGVNSETKIQAYLGIDGGSTTTKFVLMTPDNTLIDSFYANNEGEPIDVAVGALKDMHSRFKAANTNLEILGVGTTGYAEEMFAEAFSADYHVVETVAHTHAAQHYCENVSFILDIGGQDMKAMWIDGGVITNIVVNEACSSGCGSFLENFANTLNISVKDIAHMAFESKNPAALGSRCTVFMNSSIVTEQKNGKLPQDIMAGLCRSIIENVFTKVIRISNTSVLGKHIVVQGGTFKNDAVLAAFEQFAGVEVVRAPYPGLMGAIGAALLCKKHMSDNALGTNMNENGEVLSRTYDIERNGAEKPASTTPPKSTFIGIDALDAFTYKRETNITCPFCSNRCNRTCITFNNGKKYITGNRCAKGEVLGSAKDAAVLRELKAAQDAENATPNLFDEREVLLFQKWEHKQILPQNNIKIGMPRTLANWDCAPFWRVFWESLGFQVIFSPKSTRKMYERGLHAVASDTVCFPAKLVHGHVRWLAGAGVDRIFMPTITVVPTENKHDTSVSMCAVVKGYPMVMRNSDNPEKWSANKNCKYDNPLWHWYTKEDRNLQLTGWMRRTFKISVEDTLAAIAQADAAQSAFHVSLQTRGAEVLQLTQQQNKYAVVLASRPYQNDSLVNHDLPKFFTDAGIPVISVDALPGVNNVDLHNSLIDITNNYHARMLSGAVLAATNPHLEYVQIVSFGCGHDAYLTDEITRIMHELSNKSPLVLKVDESDIKGPLRIRVRSFIETVNMKRAAEDKKSAEQCAYGTLRGLRGAHALRHSTPSQAAASTLFKENAHSSQTDTLHPHLSDPYPQKFTHEHAKTFTVLCPNTSHAFCLLMSAAFASQGIKMEPLPVGYDAAIHAGKKYVHNDICFPCQIVIGEAIAALQSGKYDPNKTGVAMAKYIGDCRLTHYTALLRRALDSCGFKQVPIITNDDVDYHNIHPGFKMNLLTAARIAYGLPMIDALEELLRKMRPYELHKGESDAAFERAISLTTQGLQSGGVKGAKQAFKKAIEIMRRVPYDRTYLRPRVLIVGEYLLNFHTGANHDIERYLEDNGMEIIEARMTDVIRKSYFYKDAQNKEYKLNKPASERALFNIENNIFNLAHDTTDKIAAAHPLYKPATRMQDLVRASDPIIHHTFDAGEGVLIPGEILHHAANGCRAFVILQPFGCLPNHVVGRGIAKRLKELYPDAQILPLDYDPDVSFANIENRLQMLIMNAKRNAPSTSSI